MINVYRSVLFAIILSSLLLGLPHTGWTQVIRYVSTTGTNANPASATSWATSTTNLQGAINASSAGDQVWVRSGTFKPTLTAARDISFSMKNGVAIYGGFVGNETSLSQRAAINPTAGTPSSTTLSGNLDSDNTPNNNSFHVINNNSIGLTNTAILDGFVIADGAANGSGTAGYGDGSLGYVLSGDDLGGGVFNGAGFNGNQCSPTFRFCTFANNQASQKGGAMFNKGYEGGICDPVLTNCAFLNNQANGGGAILSWGDGYVYTGFSRPVLTNCAFWSNQATYGGAMYNDGAKGNSSPVLTNCAFLGNQAQIGGAMFNDTFTGFCNLVLTSSTFQSNVASSAGGALFNNTFSNVSVVLANSVLFNNGGANSVAGATAAATFTATYTLLESSITGVNISGPGNLLATTTPFASTSSAALAVGSAAINAGNPASQTVVNGPYSATALPVTDFQGNQRIVGGRVDMGAVESPTVASAPPMRLYVAASQTTNIADGLTWSSAFPNLQSALTYPNSQSLTEIWVAAGTYKPTATTTRTLSFQMRNGLAIYGGFRGNELDLSLRPAINPVTGSPSSSTLSGDIDNDGTLNGNSIHLINNPTGLTTTAVLDGFVLTGGNADGSSPNERGGGILNNGGSSPTLRNLMFENNSAQLGGALFNSGGSAVVTNSNFQRNISTGFGGAIYSDGASTYALTNCGFRENRAVNGGALAALAASQPTITNCTFLSNTATSGGGVLFADNSSPLFISGSFQNNQGGSGGISAIQNNAAPVLTNCVLFGNGGANTFNSLVTVQYSMLDQTVIRYTSDPTNLTITASPFVSTTPGTPSDLALNGCTPAINAGNPASQTVASGPYSTTALPATDLLGNPRIRGNRVDMGAIEYQTTPNPYVGITQQPSANGLACAGSPYSSVPVSASGTGPLTFQWYKAGPSGIPVLLPDQTSATLSLPSAQTADSGNYSVVVTGACNSVTSTAFSLTVNLTPSRLYVRANAMGAGTGLSWADAFPDLQTALAYGYGNSCAQNLTEIWVAQGVYKPTSSTDRMVSFAMRNGVSIFGGFVGNETSLSQRPTINLANGPGGASQPSSSTLSGDIGAVGNNADNSNHVISNPRGLDASAVLDGFVITGGNGDLGGGVYNNGIYVDVTTYNISFCNPTFRNCAFVSNSAGQGGAIYNNGFRGAASPTLLNCLFQGNSANQGGAIYNNSTAGSGANPKLISCAFLGNSAGQGGTVFTFSYADGSSPEFINCSWQGNSAGQGSVLFNRSEGYFVTINPVLTNCVLFGNGGGNTFVNSSEGNSVFASVSANYSLMEPSVGGYNGSQNIITNIAPFVSTTTVALNTCTLAIDSANPTTTSATVGNTDLSGNPRVVHNGLDRGAVELQETPVAYAGFISQPAAGSLVCVGTAVNVPVSVSGTEPLSYQWYKTSSSGGTILVNNQTSATLMLPSVTTGDAGSYSVVVTGSCNSVTSTAFNLTTPTLTAGTLTCAQTSVTLTATGGSQYAFAGPGGGSTGIVSQDINSGMAVVNVAGVYSATVTDAGGCVSSLTVLVTSNTTPPPVMLEASATVLCNQSSLTLTATGGTSYTLLGTSNSTGVFVFSGGSFPVGVQTFTVAATPTNGCATAAMVSVTFVDAKRLYVRAGADATGNGLSWATAFPDLKTALTYNGVCAQNLTEIWVAQGVYKPTSTTDRNASFQMRNGVAIYGGFVGNETSLSQRPIINLVDSPGGASQPSSSTLSGDIGQVGNPADNSYHVINHQYGLYLDASAVLDGFVITGGNANENSFPDNSGGGIYNDYSSPMLVNCLLQGNNAAFFAGAMMNIANNSVLTNCAFRGNTAAGGGAIGNASSAPLLVNCSLQGNTASEGGGAIYNTDGNPVLVNCSLQGNTAPAGGVVYNGIRSSLRLTNSVVFNNGGSTTFFNPDGTVTATYSLFDNSVTGYISDPTNLTTVTSPFASTTSVGLNPCSPAINVGNPASLTSITGPYSETVLPATDLAGNSRIVGGRVDMGAVEYQAETLVIIQQPVAGSAVCGGSTVVASVRVNGSASAYQWYRNGTALTGIASATTASLTLTNVQTGDAGSYSVVISGDCLSLTSTAFGLTVNSPPTVTLTASISLLTCTTPTATLTASGAAGAPGTSYSFSGPGILASNPTSGTALVNATGSYSVTVTTANGCSATASIALSYQNCAPTVANNIPSQSATVGNSFSYSIPTNTFTDAETPNSLILSVVGLPAGLSFVSPNTITGVPSTTVGSPFSVTVVASDPGGGSVATIFQLSVSQAGGCNSMYTIKAGNWTDVSVWSCGRLPTGTDVVTLNHAVNLPASYQGQALRMIYSLAGNLVMEANSRLQLGSN
ncbi:choice-of-anchor Q domain-containing protein [Spirosoma endbachense]|uniref:Ig-like domain-containing protein n=1 Tax=Spirosoma endbachense TaxID=2666025 RepID=A0A6P1W3W6_9BACT|nr:choice-of-anchor Q domain-containing protein [Spirosoma endbachense]QHV99715.1 hypothetical protein GJR95_33980 [Spirosoma endbachense]